jgi:hypothetical protein
MSAVFGGNSERSSDSYNYQCKVTVTLDLTLTFEATKVDASTETADTACSPMTMLSLSASCFPIVIQPHQIYWRIASTVFVLFMKPAPLLCAVLLR